MFVAITGGIACGKSLALEFIKNRGYPVYSADKIGHRLLSDKNVIEKLKKDFGENIIKNNRIDRKQLGEIVFSDKEKIKKLNAILHPEIEKEIDRIKKEETHKIVFFEIPLLFEVNKQNEYDITICIYCNKDVQIKRLKKRNALTLSQAKQRISNQLPMDKKIRLSDFAVENNGNLEDFLLNLDEVLKKIEEKTK